MPNMTGYEVTRRIRENKSLPHIPIILVTAHEELSAESAKRVGADGLIYKPFDIQAVLSRIEDTLQQKKHQKKGEYELCC